MMQNVSKKWSTLERIHSKDSPKAILKAYIEYPTGFYIRFCILECEMKWMGYARLKYLYVWMELHFEPIYPVKRAFSKKDHEISIKK